SASSGSPITARSSRFSISARSRRSYASSYQRAGIPSAISSLFVLAALFGLHVDLLERGIYRGESGIAGKERGVARDKIDDQLAFDKAAGHPDRPIARYCCDGL